VIAGDALACDNALPLLSVSGDESVSESASGTLTATATDRNDDALSYTWTQLSGTTATLTGADTATLGFTPGAISSDDELVFEVTVNDGTDSVSEQFTVAVTNEAEPVEEKKVTKSSNGSFGFLTLLLAPLALIGRRRKRK